MKITFEGRDWEFDLGSITLKQAISMKLAYGYTVDSWLAALGETDPCALQCLYWLMLQQDGKPIPLKDADCRIVDLSAAFADAYGEQGEAEPDPTMPPPPSPPPAPASPAPPIPPAMTPLPVPMPVSPYTAYTPAI